MGVSTHGRRRLRRALGLALALVLGVTAGCAGTGPSRPLHTTYHYFGVPAADDPWSHKIRGWQTRQVEARRSDPHPGIPAVGEGGPVESESGLSTDTGLDAEVGSLRAEYETFRSERRRELARELVDWLQVEARNHYREDGPVDHWATLEETLRANGDDCDGLELLALNLLRELGFGDQAVYRAVVYRKSDNQHHMVTLWFESPDDPWVLDPTGAMTSGMPRMSEVPEWVPIKVFNETEDFSVEARRTLANR